MSAESPRHARSGGPLTIPSQPPADRTLIDAVSGFINDVTLSSNTTPDPKDTIQWARFETADINEPTPEGDGDNDMSPLLLILGYGSGVQVWLIPPNGEAQEVLSWRQGTVRILRILPSPATGDIFVAKRPLIALCDSASPGPMFCSLSFLSIRGGEQVKSIKFKNQILDVQANKHSVVVSFSERFAVFDAGSLEDRIAITTCYPCPCPLGGNYPINPIALGDRWLAYADRKINPSKRSSGGCEGEGVSSYTATVLHAAKSLSKGLRGLGESVAHSLAGGRATSQSPSPPNADLQQPGVVTILDIVGNTEEECQDTEEQFEPIVAHFLAHLDAIIALKFDASGMLLVTADRRGHDFHVFRINPHPCGSSLASVHHLYILHRGDTTAKVQDIALSSDGRWAAISSLRGTTHVFPISPYGGAPCVRTHTPPRVVNRLSRFHRSAGLPCDTVSETASWFPNPRVPPYPVPTKLSPMAQLRASTAVTTHLTRTSSGRQRLSSLSEDGSAAPLLARARFGPAPTASRPSSQHSLYLMTANGTLVHHVLHPRPTNYVPKEKVCEESGIELEVEAVARWPLQRPPAACDLLAPLHHSSPLLQLPIRHRCAELGVSEEERWLSQVEIVTHAGPHRRLWMGPQFVFKTYNVSGSNSSLSEAETVEIDTSVGALPRSNPVNVPAGRPLVPVLIDEGSASSLEHSPSETFRRKSAGGDRADRAAPGCIGGGDLQLREDLAEAMKEDHGACLRRSGSGASRAKGVHRAVAPRGTVVDATTPHECPPSALGDGGHLYDAPAIDNPDEGAFRPVLNAPAHIHPHLPSSPLPVDTTIPALALPINITNSYEDLVEERSEIKVECEVLESLPLEDVRIKNSPTSKMFSENVEKDCKEFVSNASFKFDDVGQNSENSVLTAEVTLKIPARAKIENLNLDAKDKILKDNLDKKNNVVDIVKLDNNSVPEIKQRKIEERIVSEKPYVIDEKIKQSGNIEDVKVVKEDPETILESRHKPQPLNIPEVIVDNNKPLIEETKEKTPLIHETKETPLLQETKEKDIPKRNVETENNKEIKKTKLNRTEVVNKCEKPGETDKSNITKSKDVIKTKVKKPKYDDDIEIITEQPHFTDTKLNMSGIIEKELSKEKTRFSKISESRPVPIPPKVEEIKTEQQAWDMLLNEHDTTPPLAVRNLEKSSEEKPKSKKGRKSKFKPFEDVVSSKAEEDSFVEIHNIVDNQPSSTNELVSLSTDYDASSLFKSKQNKSKSQVIEKENNDFSSKTFDLSRDIFGDSPTGLEPEGSNTRGKYISVGEVSLEPKADKGSNNFKCSVNSLNIPSDINFYAPNEGVRTRKTKSASPFYESKKGKTDSQDKDVIVIDSTKENFPEIQITKGKGRKKSPSEMKVEDILDKPKSWSSIAAPRGASKLYEIRQEDGPLHVEEAPVEKPKSYLQEKLVELCKRTDIMVAECDSPSELNFVEEHHVMRELPALEPLDFVLDDFKLEVMRDSLLEIPDPKPSPICKINIDDILSTIKETTTKAMESGAFKYASVAREDGFDVVESENVTSTAVDVKFLEVESRQKNRKEEEKSSDDDNTSPPASQTDSDKDGPGGTVTTLPSFKQSKAKKPRKKKKTGAY